MSVYQRLLPEAEDEDVVSLVQNLVSINTQLEKGLHNLGGPRDTKRLRESLHQAVQRGMTVTQGCAAELKQYDGLNKQKLVNHFQQEARRFQRVSSQISSREHQVVDAIASGYSIDADSHLTQTKEQVQSQDHVASMVVMEPDLVNLEDRKAALTQIEGDVMQISEMMGDLALLTEEQQYHIDMIEDNITSGRDYVVAGEGQLHKASNYQRKSRAKLCILLLVVVLGLLALVLGLWGFK